MATEKDSQRILCPWFDKNEIKHLHEWLTLYLSDAIGSDLVLQMRDLLDVDYSEDLEGQVFYNIPDGSGGGTVQLASPYEYVVLTPGVTALDPPKGRHMIYVATGTSHTFSLPMDATDDTPLIFTIYNDTTDGVTLDLDPGPTITFPDTAILSFPDRYMQTRGEWLTFRRVGVNTFVAMGSLLGSPNVYGTNSSEIENAVPRMNVNGNSIAATPVVIESDGKMYGYNAKTNAQTGTTYTLTAADAGKVITMSNAAAITLTLENSLPAGFCCTVIQKGAGQITFTPEAGASRVNRSGHTKSAGQYAVCTLYVDSNSGTDAVYYLAGDTAA
jgi:hypothetical protein